MFTLQIPADGSSVPVGEFSKAAKEALDLHEAVTTDDDRAMLEAAISAASLLVKAGHAGEGNVYVVVGTAGPQPLNPNSGNILNISVNQRPATIKKVLAEPLPATPPISPYDTGPKQYEIEREAAATGKSLEQTAVDLGANSVVVTKHDKGVTSTTVHALVDTPAKRSSAKPQAPAPQTKAAAKAQAKAQAAAAATPGVRGAQPTVEGVLGPTAVDAAGIRSSDEGRRNMLAVEPRNKQQTNPPPVRAAKPAKVKTTAVRKVK